MDWYTLKDHYGEVDFHERDISRMVYTLNNIYYSVEKHPYMRCENI